MRRLSWLLPMIGLGLLTSGCGASDAPPAPEPPADPAVLAAWDDGVVTVTDVDAYFLDHPGARRPDRSGTIAARVEEAAIRIVAERALRTPDAIADVEADPRFAEALEARRRARLAQAFVERRDERFEVTVAEAREIFEAREDEMRQPERRMFRLLLLARPPDAGPEEMEALCERAAELRDRARAGASFEALVVEHSDASNAATGGLIAGVTRKQLRSDAAEVVFSLEPGEISDPLRNEAGCQIFQLQMVQPAIEPSFGLVRERLIMDLADERRREYRRELLRQVAEELEVDLPRFLDEPLFADLPADTELFAFDGVRITLRDLAQATPRGQSPSAVLARLVAEPLFAAAFRRNHPEEAESIAAEVREEVLQEMLLGRAMREYLLGLPEELLRERYDGASESYRTDPQTELTLYHWPIGSGDPLKSLERPRAFAERVAEADAEELEAAIAEAIADEPGLRTTDLPLSSVRELGRRRSDLGAVLVELEEEGQVIGPFRSGEEIVVARVRTWVPGRSLSFLEARERIREEIGRDRGGAMLDELSRFTADNAGLTVFPERTESFGERLLARLTGATS